jgi:DNA-binding NarL/FixJ family response regulator
MKNRVRILLADDHDLIRAGIGNALADQPHLEIVGEVDDGPSLLQALSSLRPDLLLIDANMPNFEPIATMQRVRITYPALFILVVSAYDDDVYVQGLFRAGVNGYHLKDQPLSDLRLAIDRVLSGKRWISDPLVDKLLRPNKQKNADTPKLSPRQLDMLNLLVKGLDNRSMAAQLGLSVKTIETHLTRLYRQLNVQSRLEATNYAHRHPELIAPSAVISSPQQIPVSADKHSSIMIVDDNKRFRSQLRRMIGRICPQVQIFEAGDSEAALHLIRHYSPRMAFVDVVLGDENGIHCARRIKAESAQSRVILMSAYPDREFHRQGLEAGAIAFIDKKDLDTASLFQIISDAMD